MVTQTANTARPPHPLQASSSTAAAWILREVLVLSLVTAQILLWPALVAELFGGPTWPSWYVFCGGTAGFVAIVLLTRWIAMHTPGALARGGQARLFTPYPALIADVIRAAVVVSALVIAATHSDERGIVAMAMAFTGGVFLALSAWSALSCKLHDSPDLTIRITSHIAGSGVPAVAAMYLAFTTAHSDPEVIRWSIFHGVLVSLITCAVIYALTSMSLRRELTNAQDDAADRLIAEFIPAATLDDHERARKWVRYAVIVAAFCAAILSAATFFIL